MLRDYSSRAASINFGRKSGFWRVGSLFGGRLPRRRRGAAIGYAPGGAQLVQEAPFPDQNLPNVTK